MKAIMRIDVQFSGKKGQPKRTMRDFHAPCVDSETRGKLDLEVIMTVGASIVMITFIGLLLRTLV